MFLFHKISLPKVDPLGGGLAEEIAAEQADSESIVLEEQLDSHLAEQWESIVEDVKQDPEWFEFADSE